MKLEDVKIGMKVKVTVGNYDWRDPADYDYLTRTEGYNGQVLTVYEIDTNDYLIHGPGVSLLDNQGMLGYFAQLDEIEPVP